MKAETPHTRRSLHRLGTYLNVHFNEVLNEEVAQKIRSNFRTTATSRYEINVAFKAIFLFQMPSLYFGIIEHMLMVISVYCGLWITHFQAAIYNLFAGDRKAWIVTQFA